MNARTGKALSILAVMAALAVSTVGGAAWATHNFADVGDGTQWAEEIDTGAEAGCYTGFPDGTFQRRENANRGQFAFWLNNCAGRAGMAYSGAASSPVTSAGDVTLQTIDVEVAGTGSQYVHLTASLAASASQTLADACGGAMSCGAVFWLSEDGVQITGTFYFRKNVDATAQQPISFSTVVPAEAGVHTYDLVGSPFFLGPSGQVFIQAPTITALTAPFSTDPAIVE